MSVDYRVISIGAMAHNRLWGETGDVRTAHATTVLVTDGDMRMLVDPSLPVPALAARFNERTGQTLDTITDVFCTTLHPVCRRSISAMPNANWWANETELAWFRQALYERQAVADRLGPDEAATYDAEERQLKQFRAAPDKFSPQINLYPLPGVTPGCSGLLLTPPTSTTLIAGAAACTIDHIHAGQVWDGAEDPETALDSLRDAVGIADVLICGYDNLLVIGRQWL